MRIAFVVDDFHGGAGNIAQLLALNFAKEHEVSLVLTNAHSEPRYDLSGIELHFENLSIQGKNKLLGIYNSIKKIGTLLREKIKAELVISFLDNNNTMVCLSQFFCRTPIIAAERSNPLVIFPKAPWDKLRRIAYRRADVVTVQFDCFRGFDGGRFTHKTRVTSNIVKSSPVIKQEYKTDKVRFVTMGRFAPIKRMNLMIELFDEAQKKCPDIELHIYGDGPQREVLEGMIKERALQDKVFLEGYCNDVHNTLVQYDVYLMTSRQEGFPNSLSEAMAAGLPSVSTLCHDGIAEMTQNGKSGLYSLEGEKEDFVEKMIFLAQNEALRREMGKNATYISEKYSSDAIMKQWQACIDEAIKKNEKKAGK